MNVIKLSLVAAAATAAMGFAGAASAADITYNIGAATDYVFRGIDQTGSSTEGEIFGGVDATFGKALGGAFYAGVWVSNTGPSGADLFEGDLYAGWKPSIGPVALDLGAIYYGYNGANSGASDYELKAAASVPLGGLTVGAAVYYGPDNDGFGGQDTTYVEGNAAYTFANKATVSAAYGSFDADALGDYTTWNAGVTYPVSEKISVDVRYIGTEGSANLYNGAVATLKLTF